MQSTPKVLFLSTGDSTRSQMAEGFLREWAGDQIVAISAGISLGVPNPIAVEVMREVGIEISGQTSKSVSESLKEHFAYVVTICDPAKERFPIFPFTPNLLHWSLMDPTTAHGSYRTKHAVFRRVRDEISVKVQSFVGETLQNIVSLTAVVGGRR